MEKLAKADINENVRVSTRAITDDLWGSYFFHGWKKRGCGSTELEKMRSVVTAAKSALVVFKHATLRL